MGTWGFGLFSDDTARDVKGDWEELYKRFGEPVETTRELLAAHPADDGDDGPVVILALAMCQHKYGCLQPAIKARALDVISRGAGLHIWGKPKDLARRRAVYASIATALEQPQPPLKRIKKLTPREITPFMPGQLLKYRCWDGEYVLLWVRELRRFRGDVLPVCAALDWKGLELPDRRTLQSLHPVIFWNDSRNLDPKLDSYIKASPGAPQGSEPLRWTAYIPMEMSRFRFDASRVEVVPGTWHWDLFEQGGGPLSLPWASVGTAIAEDLSTTNAYRKTLLRFRGDPDARVVPPKHPRPRVLPSGPQRPLGIDVLLPEGRAVKNSEILVFNRSRHVPSPGDIFAVNVLGKRWVVGRVILTDGAFAGGPSDILVYFYRQLFDATSQIMLPMRLDDLIFAPNSASEYHWTSGDFYHIANVPLEPCELPARHIFRPPVRGRYYIDAYGMPTPPPSEDELVGTASYGGFGGGWKHALGID